LPGRVMKGGPCGQGKTAAPALVLSPRRCGRGVAAYHRGVAAGSLRARAKSSGYTGADRIERTLGGSKLHGEDCAPLRPPLGTMIRTDPTWTGTGPPRSGGNGMMHRLRSIIPVALHCVPRHDWRRTVLSQLFRNWSALMVADGTNEDYWRRLHTSTSMARTVAGFRVPILWSPPCQRGWQQSEAQSLPLSS